MLPWLSPAVLKVEMAFSKRVLLFAMRRRASLSLLWTMAARGSVRNGSLMMDRTTSGARIFLPLPHIAFIVSVRRRLRERLFGMSHRVPLTADGRTAPCMSLVLFLRVMAMLETFAAFAAAVVVLSDRFWTFRFAPAAIW